uniref:J domain-containing protein n=1 Tax=Chromulina nebulosa TaxID=96789 RepID=A0A7S0SR92_9STRA|mmetsp:Transcript_1330/g.1172  ORF Transcript_1330/g.1172 Transcript_1330/m.1172 type:complete len:346 (+) Transcript_1330:63-1100(+)|eukprot:CAMPEP_0196765656 /NCGR_PEP_ID=MMETSP1095-20130614/10279_1 /TAXON_ID=96789 ORGANISM="Chromulina nebulosa, Strain UTEXLB2642" /NCGR_SAMPLE_ID=MMETSP1095 /ASSEMBLY_ACC=CAM_ASM_000446 /LENGTH=345 /DNA_ID=CAMNT_0042124073 /DNA_START=56 /DNA_END=1093 /DNA_ORIENTATION=-
MGKDYYKVLNVNKNASVDEIKKSYKKLALKWHPDRVTPDKKDEAQAKFQEISQAFEVLSDPEKRKVYDQVGEEGLNGGIPTGADGASFNFSGMPQGATFHFSHSSADDIFRNFFGTSDPFAAAGESGGFGGSSGFGGMPFMASMGGGGMPRGFTNIRPTQSQALTKAPPVNHTLYVTLEDIYTGVLKRMRITKKILDASGVSTQVTVDKEIQVKPGWKDGTKITFEREGDESPGIIPADIIFTLQTKPHDRFERDGDDLIHKCSVSLYEAFSGVRKTIQTLDSRQLVIEARSVCSDTVKLYPNEGMPNTKKQIRGNLKVKFDIKVPELTAEERNQICSILKSSRK